MATTAPTLGAQAAVSKRGRPAMVTIRRTALLAGLLEGIALADDALTVTTRIHDAAMVGSRAAVLNEAGRLNSRAAKARDEFRRLAGDVEE